MATPIRPQHHLDEEGAKKLIEMLAQDQNKTILPSKKTINIDKIREIVFGKRSEATCVR